MRIATAALLLFLPAASSAEAPPAPPAVEGMKAAGAPRLCTDPFRLRPARPAGKAEPKRLGELPPADLTLAVLDRVDGCIEPRTVRQGIGAFGR